MSIRRMSHAVYDTRYHVVWVPKYRKWILRGDVKKTAEEIFREVMSSLGVEELELEAANDHVHIFASIPPKYSVGEFVRKMKSITAKEVFARHPGVKKELWGGESWNDGYFARTVGDKVTSEVVQKYIQSHKEKKEQKKKETTTTDLSLTYTKMVWTDPSTSEHLILVP